MAPGEFKRMGAGLKIRYGFSPSPFGDCLIARTDRGICHLGFVDGSSRADALAQLDAAWPGAGLVESSTDTRLIAGRIFNP